MAAMSEASTDVLIAGIGCRKGATVSELVALLDTALGKAGLSTGQLTGLASIERKRDEPGLLALASRLNLPLHFWPVSALPPPDTAQQQTYPSATLRILALVGTPSVAETTALAQAALESGNVAKLLVCKCKTAHATVAIAFAARPTDPRAAAILDPDRQENRLP